jgi:hypothetical protein
MDILENMPAVYAAARRDVAEVADRSQSKAAGDG